MLKLVLDSVNVDLGWGTDKCYSKVKDTDLNTLLSDVPKGECGELAELDSYLQYYVFDLCYGVEDISLLDSIMSLFKDKLVDSLMLFDSYVNYEQSKLSGSKNFKVVISDLANYDVACFRLLNAINDVYLTDYASINLVVFDYVDRELKTLPFTSISSDDHSFDNVILFNSLPLILSMGKPMVKYDISKNMSLGVFKGAYMATKIGVLG